jgi:hypothetical protein
MYIKNPFSKKKNFKFYSESINNEDFNFGRHPPGFQFF